MSYIVSAVESIADASASRDADRPRVHDLSRHDRRSRAAAARSDRAEGRQGFFPGLLPERVDPGNPTFQTHNMPKVVGGLTPDLLGAGRRALRHGDRDDRAGQLHARGGNGEAAREHVPRGQHRPGERTRADVRPHEHRRLGSRRCGEDQAVRLHGVLPRPGPRRTLHPDRSVLPVVEGEAERLRSALHRTGRPHQWRRCRTTSSTRSAER